MLVCFKGNANIAKQWTSISFIFAYNLHPHNRIGRGNLVLRHSLPYFSKLQIKWKNKIQNILYLILNKIFPSIFDWFVGLTLEQSYHAQKAVQVKRAGKNILFTYLCTVRFTSLGRSEVRFSHCSIGKKI